MRIPTPWWWIRTRPSTRPWATTGASPADISSTSSTRGSVISALPIASICCSPPDRLPANCRRRSSSLGKSSKTPSERHGAGDPDVIQPDVSLPGTKDAGDGAEHGRLARAVRSQQPDDLVGSDDQVHAVEHRRVGVADGDVDQLEAGHSGCPK
jgi:hypothetical protein